MTTEKMSAFGTDLYRAGSLIAQVDAISGPGMSLDTEDVTTHDSPDGWEEVIGTILRSGELTLDLLFDPGSASHAALVTQMEAKEDEDFELRFPDGAQTSWDFDAFVTGIDPDAPHSGALRASVTLKITGTPVLDSSYSE